MIRSLLTHRAEARDGQWYYDGKDSQGDFSNWKGSQARSRSNGRSKSQSGKRSSSKPAWLGAIENY